MMIYSFFVLLGDLQQHFKQINLQQQNINIKIVTKTNIKNAITSRRKYWVQLRSLTGDLICCIPEKKVRILKYHVFTHMILVHLFLKILALFHGEFPMILWMSVFQLKLNNLILLENFWIVCMFDIDSDWF